MSQQLSIREQGDPTNLISSLDIDSLILIHFFKTPFWDQAISDQCHTTLELFKIIIMLIIKIICTKYFNA